MNNLSYPQLNVFMYTKIRLKEFLLFFTGINSKILYYIAKYCKINNRIKNIKEE